MSNRYSRLSIEQLTQYRKEFQDKIDGPENDGRITTNGSADLDYWIDMVEELTVEIDSRN